MGIAGKKNQTKEITRDADKKPIVFTSGAMVTVETNNLKERLNSAFLRLHGRNGVGHDANFDRLWDLKESAILEGKKTVELPGQWLSELETIENAERKSH
jgi:hypothetical protein